MFPYNPQSTSQLQANGLLDLGMRLLAGSGPQHPGATFGSRAGQAGVGNLEAMRAAGLEMQKMNAMRAKNQAAQQVQNRRQQSYDRLEQQAMSQGPLSGQQNTALDMAQESILSGKAIPGFATDTLYPQSVKGNKYTKSDRIMELSKKMANKTSTKAEEREYDLLINADPMTQLRRQIFNTGGGIPGGNPPPPKKPQVPLNQQIQEFFRNFGK